MPEQELQDVECYLRSLQAVGLQTLKKERQDKKATATDVELRGTAQHIYLYQLMEQVKAGSHKSNKCWNNIPESSAFRSQGPGHKNANLCTVINSRLDAICNHARNALSKANNSKSVKPLQCFCTGL